MTVPILIRGATIISMDPVVGDLTGDILINGDTIESVAAHVAAEPATEVIDAAGHIVIPGFIDSHRHLYQNLLRGLGSDWSLSQYRVGMFAKLAPNFTPEDMYLANYLGAVDALDSGVTAVFDWSPSQVTPDHTDELIRGLRDAGIRATVGYSGTAPLPRPCPLVVCHQRMP